MTTEQVDDLVDDAKVEDAAADAGQEQAKDGDKTVGVTDDAAKVADAAADADKGEGDKADDAAKPAFGDNWREDMAGGNEDIAKLIKRFGSPRGVAKALLDSQALIRSGKIKRDAPDPKDEKAMAEWRKEQGIPDDPTGYVLPEPVAKRLTDDDKPILAAFTEFAHGKNAPQSVIDIATEWYVANAEAVAEKQAEADRQAEEDAETELRKDWAHGEYKTNLTLGKRYIEQIPGLGANFAEARLPDGRLLGSVPEFIAWAADQGRQHFGDVTFATADGASRHAARKEEIEKIRDSDFERYEREGLDREYRTIIEKELARGK